MAREYIEVWLGKKEIDGAEQLDWLVGHDSKGNKWKMPLTEDQVLEYIKERG